MRSRECPEVTGQTVLSASYPWFPGNRSFFPLRNATKNNVLGVVPGSGVTGWPDGVQLDMGD